MRMMKDRPYSYAERSHAVVAAMAATTIPTGGSVNRSAVRASGLIPPSHNFKMRETRIMGRESIHNPHKGKPFG